MATRSPIAGRAAALVGRRSERDVLDRLIEAVRGGESRALVVRGEPGVGKILEIHQELPGRIHIVLIRQVIGF